LGSEIDGASAGDDEARSGFREASAIRNPAIRGSVSIISIGRVAIRILALPNRRA
jgi:hypothetical protein